MFWIVDNKFAYRSHLACLSLNPRPLIARGHRAYRSRAVCLSLVRCDWHCFHISSFIFHFSSFIFYLWQIRQMILYSYARAGMTFFHFWQFTYTRARQKTSGSSVWIMGSVLVIPDGLLSGVADVPRCYEAVGWLPYRPLPNGTLRNPSDTCWCVPPRWEWVCAPYSCGWKSRSLFLCNRNDGLPRTIWSFVGQAVGIEPRQRWWTCYFFLCKNSNLFPFLKIF